MLAQRLALGEIYVSRAHKNSCVNDKPPNRRFIETTPPPKKKKQYKTKQKSTQHPVK